MLRATLTVLLALLASAVAQANYLPYLKMAQEFGTPHFLRRVTVTQQASVRDAYLYVPQGQTDANWTKMTTVSTHSCSIKTKMSFIICLVRL